MTQKEILKEAKRLQKKAPWAIDDDGLWVPKEENPKKSKNYKDKCNII